MKIKINYFYYNLNNISKAFICFIIGLIINKITKYIDGSYK